MLSVILSSKFEVRTYIKRFKIGDLNGTFGLRMAVRFSIFYIQFEFIFSYTFKISKLRRKRYFQLKILFLSLVKNIFLSVYRQVQYILWHQDISLLDNQVFSLLIYEILKLIKIPEKALVATTKAGSFILKFCLFVFNWVWLLLIKYGRGSTRGALVWLHSRSHEHAYLETWL